MGLATKKLTTLTASSQRNKIIAVAVVLILLIAGYAVMRSQAAGFFASSEPENGTLANGTTVVADTNASGGKALQFKAAPVTPTPPTTGNSSCPLPAYPTPSCTGMRSTPAKTHNGSMTITQDGTVIDNMLVTGGITIRANGVVIKNSIVYGQIFNWVKEQNYPFTIMDSTVGPPSGCGGASDGIIGANYYTATRVHVRNSIDGLRVAENNVNPNANVTIQDSYISICSTSTTDHSDGIQMHGEGRNVVIKHNTIDQRNSEYATAPIFGGTISTTIADNLVMGGGYGIQIYDVTSATKVVNNRIVDGSWYYSPMRIQPCMGVSGNTRVTIDANYKITGTKGSAEC